MKIFKSALGYQAESCYSQTGWLDCCDGIWLTPHPKQKESYFPLVLGFPPYFPVLPVIEVSRGNSTSIYLPCDQLLVIFLYGYRQGNKLEAQSFQEGGNHWGLAFLWSLCLQCFRTSAKSVDDTKLSSALGMLEGRDPNQRDVSWSQGFEK